MPLTENIPILSVKCLACAEHTVDNIQLLHTQCITLFEQKVTVWDIEYVRTWPMNEPFRHVCTCALVSPLPLQ